MPTLFLSPSTQEYNLYVTSGNEELYMNQIADAMEPYLRASGIDFLRNDPALTVGGSVRLSNAAMPDLHLAIHSNAGPESLAGRLQGTDVYYYHGSAQGEAIAQLIAGNIGAIYPYPELVGPTPTKELYELNNTKAPSVLVEVAYHDNVEDAEWITGNIDAIAKALTLSVTQYFGIPFVLPDTVQRGRISTEGFSINIRATPSWGGEILGTVPNGTDVIVTGRSGAWYIIDYMGIVGYVPEAYMTLL